MNKSIFISPYQKSWKVRLLGNNQTAEGFQNKHDAVKFASEIAKKQKVDLIVQRRDGIFQFRNY